MFSAIWLQRTDIINGYVNDKLVSDVMQCDFRDKIDFPQNLSSQSLLYSCFFLKISGQFNFEESNWSSDLIDKLCEHTHAIFRKENSKIDSTVFLSILIKV